MNFGKVLGSKWSGNVHAQAAQWPSCCAFKDGGRKKSAEFIKAFTGAAAGKAWQTERILPSVRGREKRNYRLIVSVTINPATAEAIC